MRRFLVVVALLAAASPAAAQTPEPAAPAQGPATFRTGVDVVSVDVAVVDRNGRPVEDLRPAEFYVKIDGETRRVVSAELIKVDVEAAKRAVADKSETFYTSNLTPPNGRLIMIAIDQTSVRPGSVRAVMEAATKFLTQLSPLDEVAFVAFPEPGPRLNFTRDRLRIKQAMQGLIGQTQNAVISDYNIGVTEAMAIYDKRDQLVLAEVMARECRVNTEEQRERCMRDIVDESSQIAVRVRQAGDRSRTELADLLRRMAVIDGHKAMILISEGMAVREDADIDEIVVLAGRARTSMNVLSIDLQRNDITVTELAPTSNEDRRLQLQGLEALAVRARGAFYHIVGSGEQIFDRLASEISAYYLLGVEQRPSDANGSSHRIDVSVGRQNVIIRSRQAFVLSAPQTSRRSSEENLRDALTSPFPVSGLPLRVTTFAQQDPASGKVLMTIAADVDQPGAAPGEYTLGFVVIDDQNKVTASWGGTQQLAAVGGSPNAPLAFSRRFALDPGNYTLRLAALDKAGRRGSVVRDISAWKLTGEELAFGDLIVGPIPAAGRGLVAAVEPHVAGEGVAAFIELYSTAASVFDATTVRLEIADNMDAPALTSLPVQLTPGAQPTSRVASGLIGARVLPPGRYVARAYVARGGKTVGVLTRPFVLEKSAPVDAAPRMAAASVAFSNSLPKFDRAAVVSREFMAPMFDAVEKRSATLKDAMVEARAGRYGPAALEALTAGDQEAAAFLRGLDLFIKGQLDQAATQLQLAAGPRREFFPAAFYLGAAFAAVGRDRDAAGVWQIALGKEPRPSAVYVMVADARLRDGQAPAAIEILQAAHGRDPANDDVASRLGIAFIIAGRHAEAIPVLDGFLSRHPADQDFLLASLVAHYEASRAGTGFSTADLAKLKKYGAAYRGPERALADKYLETIGVR